MQWFVYFHHISPLYWKVFFSNLNINAMLHHQVVFFLFLFFFSLFFYWRIIVLQNFVVFCQTSTWISHRYTYIPFLLNLPTISLLFIFYSYFWRCVTNMLFIWLGCEIHKKLVSYYMWSSVTYFFPSLLHFQDSPVLHVAVTCSFSIV